MPNQYVWTLLLLASTPIAMANTPGPVVVISLSDTVAQKAKVERSTAPAAATISSEIAEPGFVKRTFGRWLGNAETSSTEETSAAEYTGREDARRQFKERRDQARHKGKDNSHFNDHFRKYTKHYFGMGTDWRWFQAQAIVESEMKPHVRSRSGAMGLMQIMPRTFQEIRSQNPTYTDPFDPHYSIAAGIYYNRQLYKSWSHVENEDERRKFMFASYNAGLGNVRRAAKRVGNPVKYHVLEPALSAEPKHYVFKIERERRKIGD